MKKAVFVLILLFFFVSSISAQNEGEMSIGAGLELAQPIGNWSDAAGIGIGGTARFEYVFTEQLVGILTAGYISFGGKKVENVEFSYSAIPLLPGIKYFFPLDMYGQNKFYGLAELGLHFLSVDIKIPSFNLGGFGSSGGGTTSGSSTEFTFTLGAGYETEISDNLYLDANVKFAIVSDANYLGLRVGARMPINVY